MIPEEYQRVKDEVSAMPEVTQTEAMAAYLKLCAENESDSEHLLMVAHEIVGFCITVNDPEMIRRFIVWQTKNGPINKA